MQIIVLHGDDVNKSYQRLTKFIESAKKRNWEILYDDISLTPSLFGNDRLTIIRNYKLVNKNVLSKATGTLVIYNEGPLNKTFISSLPNNVKVEEFKLSKLLWKFLDSMNINLFHEVIKTEPPEFVFAMIVWKLKKNYFLRPSIKIAQRVEELAKIDIDVKTSKADLISSLDLFFLTKLQ